MDRSCSVSGANGLFIPLYAESPVKEPSHEMRENIVTVHGAPRGRKAYIQWGAAWFPKDTAVTTPLPCILQPSTLVWVDQSAVSQRMS